MKSMFSLVTILALSTFCASSFAQDAAKGKTLYASCLQCHGEMGEGNPEKKAPKLSGQHDWYVLKQLTEIKSGVRKSPADKSPYLKLTEQDMKDLAAYIVTL